MSKKSQNALKKGITKIISMICILGLAFGMGLSQVGIEELDEKGISAVFEKSIEILEQMMEDSDTLSGDSIGSSSSKTSSTSRKNDTSNSTKTISSKERIYEGVEGIDDKLNIYVFYVGQADCTLIECDGKYLLIDAGNNEDGTLIVKKLKAMGIKEIECFIVSHTHEDHCGGADDIINAFKIKKLYIPNVPKSNCDTETYKSVKKAASDNNVARVAPEVGDIFNIGGATCEIMTIDNNNKDMNLTSITVEVTYGTRKFLAMGDAEIYNEELRMWNDIDILKVGHHGSSTSTGDDFLAQTKPEVSLISCGIDNSYGHPHDEVMDALDEYNVEIYRTDTEGTIHVVSDGEKYGVEILEDINLDGN